MIYDLEYGRYCLGLDDCWNLVYRKTIMKKVAVYGNLFYDTIHEVAGLSLGQPNTCLRTYTRLGGVGNFLRAASPIMDAVGITCVGSLSRDIVPLLNGYNIQPLHIYGLEVSKSTVIADVKSSIRTSIVEYGACTKFSGWEPIDADWHHIMYLDCLNIDLSKFSGCDNVSVDFSDSNKIFENLDRLKHIDYLITDHKGYGYDILSNIPTRKGVLLHSPTYSVFADRQNYSSDYIIEPVSGLNVLGAGDYYAAFAISELLQNSRPSLSWIHNKTVCKLHEQTRTI